MTASRYNVLARPELPMSNYVFQSERAEKMSGSAFWRMVSEAGDRTGLSVKVYAHQLRHAWGYYLANKGYDLRLIQDYLGHKPSAGVAPV
jgi:site-specific recombinase XerD